MGAMLMFLLVVQKKNVVVVKYSAIKELANTKECVSARCDICL